MIDVSVYVNVSIATWVPKSQFTSEQSVMFFVRNN